MGQIEGMFIDMARKMDRCIFMYMLYFTLSMLSAIFGTAIVKANKFNYVNKWELLTQAIGIIALVYSTYTTINISTCTDNELLTSRAQLVWYTVIG